MGCITTIELENIVLDCNDIPVGGIKEIYIANACDCALTFNDKVELDGGGLNPDFGKVTTCGFTASANPEIGEVYSLEFNKKDGITGWSEVKTIENSGLITNVPTLTIEFPKMTQSKRNLLNDVLNPNVYVLLFVHTAAGTKHVLGAKFGMTASEGAGASGTGRAEKNAYSLTFIGEESELSYSIPEDIWLNVENRVSVDTTGATNVDWTADVSEGTTPRKDCIPTPAV